MKKRTSNTANSLFILSLFMFLFACNVPDACAGFYVVAVGGKPVGTGITSLPYTISSSGFYYIAKDLTCPQNTHGITITADNVTLDLMGFSLNGPGFGDPMNGIHMDGRSNVEIRNGTVRNFSSAGIYENSTSAVGHRITNIRVSDNGAHGIFLRGKGHTVTGCTAVMNGSSGIFVERGSPVTGNTCYSNGTDGIVTGGDSTVTGNTCYSNGNDGMFIGGGSTVTNNTCYSNSYYGINAGHGTTVTSNTCSYNGYYGISAGLGSTVTGNNCSSNGLNGIVTGVGSTITNNTTRSNTGTGIYLSGDNFVDQNTATDNATNMNSCATCTFGTNHAP